MKIVCEACQAKYSISDDKVRGKAFKIRCKKCSHIIVVRSGDGSSSAQLPQQSAEPAAAPAPSENSWHLVIEGEQVGPLSASDIRARLARGEISGETYIWREGMADWLKVSSVPEFGDTGGPDEDAGTPFPMQAPTTVYPPGTAESAFAASPGGEQDVFSAPTMVSSNANAADLFAAPQSAASEPAPAPSFSFGSAGPDPAPRHTHGGNGASTGGGLTGQRHENSVLFSLSNLEALAAPNASSNMAPRPGVSGPSEGSGLIDIRSMAAMTLGNQNEGRPSHDLPAFGAPQFSPVSPVLLPLGSPSGPSKAVIAIVALAVVAIGLGGATVYMLQSGKSDSAAPNSEPTTATSAPAPAAAPPTTPPPATATNPTTPPVTTTPAPANEVLPPREQKTPVAAAPGKGGRKPDKGRPARGGGRPSEAPAPSSAPVATSSAPAPSAPARAEAPAPKGDRLDDLLSAALGSKKPAPARGGGDDEPRKAAAAPAAASLPALEKSDIVRSLSAVTGKVKGCYNQYKVPGTAMVNIKVARGGRVSDANVAGKFAGTPTGSCVENAVKDAKFPPTEAQTFMYPFALH